VGIAAVFLESTRAEAAGNAGIYVEGPSAGEVRNALTAVAPKGVTVVPADALSRALAGSGQKGSFLGPLLKRLDGKGHDGELNRIRKTEADLGLDVVLLIRLRIQGQDRQFRFVAIGRTDGEEDTKDLPYKPGEENGATGDLVSRARQAFEPYADLPDPPPSELKATNDVMETAPAPEDDRGAGVGSRPQGVFNRSLFEIELAGEGVGRHFDYNDGLSPNLRTYDVAPAAMLSAAAEVFPFAGASNFLRDIGVTGSYARSLFLESSLAGVPSIDTVESAYSVGLRFRLHPWGDYGTLFAVSDQYAVQSFTFDSAGAILDGQVPSVDYQANRTAVDVRVPFGPFALLAGAGFRAVLSAGDVASRFRGSTVEGVDGEFGVSLSAASGWEGRLVGHYERYFYAFGPTPGDAYVAGGALDQFFGGRLAMAYVF
jgi:hypothetical protein